MIRRFRSLNLLEKLNGMSDKYVNKDVIVKLQTKSSIVENYGEK